MVAITVTDICQRRAATELVRAARATGGPRAQVERSRVQAEEENRSLGRKGRHSTRPEAPRLQPVSNWWLKEGHLAAWVTPQSGQATRAMNKYPACGKPSVPGKAQSRGNWGPVKKEQGEVCPRAGRTDSDPRGRGGMARLVPRSASLMGSTWTNGRLWARSAPRILVTSWSRRQQQVLMHDSDHQ